MCIIDGPVSDVNSTKLLAFPSKNHKRQITVYSNTVSTENQNIMCLPVPNPKSISFENVPKDIFDQCKKSFSRSRKYSSSLFLTDSSVDIHILSHGSYDVIILNSINRTDIQRIPQSFGFLNENVIKFLESNYPINFGLILCKLKPGMVDYEPFGYSHDIYDNKLFFPTKHYHEHDNQLAPINIQYVTADWDHVIYSLLTPLSAHNHKSMLMLPTNEIDWNKMPQDFRVGKNISLRCMTIKGSNHENIDIEIPVVS